jgi:hypothetical protein
LGILYVSSATDHGQRRRDGNLLAKRERRIVYHVPCVASLASMIRRVFLDQIRHRPVAGMESASGSTAMAPPDWNRNDPRIRSSISSRHQGGDFVVDAQTLPPLLLVPLLIEAPNTTQAFSCSRLLCDDGTTQARNNAAAAPVALNCLLHITDHAPGGLATCDGAMGFATGIMNGKKSVCFPQPNNPTIVDRSQPANSQSAGRIKNRKKKRVMMTRGVA